MRYLRELLEGLPADTPGWRILASELRIFFFKFGQLAVQLIVLAVSNGGRRFLIIATIVLSDVAPQRFDTSTRFRFGHVLIIRMRIRETMALSLRVRHPELRRRRGTSLRVAKDANVICVISTRIGEVLRLPQDDDGKMQACATGSLDFARDDCSGDL